MDDPFAQPSGAATFERPNPGGIAGAWAAPVGFTQTVDSPAVDHGVSPLMVAANRLLLLVPALRQTRGLTNPAQLRASLAQAVRDFATQAHQLGVAPERINAARYVLCTMLDETAADTPWGGSGVWGRHSLLAEFHNEAFGGEKVFQLMARLADKPEANRDLLELIYAALALGFEGRYRVVAGGAGQLEALRARLAQMLAQVRGPYAPALASHWQAAPAPPRRLPSWLPLAAAATCSALLLGLAYGSFSWTLAQRSDPVFAAIQSLRLSPPVAPTVHPATQPRLATFLSPDIRAGLVAVRDDLDRSVVTVRGDGLFAPASASLMAEREALMQRIGEAVARIGGSVLVVGYTDSTRMQSLRFPSNWHLSEERARVVADLLVSAGLPRERVRAEGRAEADPVAPNDTPANRALNRRVEVTVFTTRDEAALARPASGSPR
jgi:type VI secretion system protein ImpK